jgi:hypothetical protein
MREPWPNERISIATPAVYQNQIFIDSRASRIDQYLVIMTYASGWVKHSGIRSQVGNQLLSPECFTPTKLSVSGRSVAGLHPSQICRNRRSRDRIHQQHKKKTPHSRRFPTQKSHQIVQQLPKREGHSTVLCPSLFGIQHCCIPLHTLDIQMRILAV